MLCYEEEVKVQQQHMGYVLNKGVIVEVLRGTEAVEMILSLKARSPVLDLFENYHEIPFNLLIKDLNRVLIFKKKNPELILRHAASSSSV